MPDSTVETTGWAPEPPGRGTVSLLWSCFATIFLCTWSAIHPNLPAPGEGEWSIIIRRVGYVLLALGMPELCVIDAVGELIEARRLKSMLTCPLRHAFFVNMGGVAVKSTDTRTLRVRPQYLVKLVQQGKVVLSTIESSDIDDRSKSDWMVKTIAFIQILWFVVQILGRAIDGKSTTTLELFTLANVCCGATMYAVWWEKPFDVRTPIVLGAEVPLRDVHVLERVHFFPKAVSTDWMHLAMFVSSFVLFGGLHVVGWNFYFSSDAERWLWRLCSIVCTLTPIFFFTLTNYVFTTECYRVSQGFYWLCVVLYFLARLYMLVEVFVGLRLVPKDVYQTVQWSQYFPSLG